MKNTQQTPTAEQWADTLVNRLFANRTGHGATPGVVYMQMRPPALRDVARESFVAGSQYACSTLTGVLVKENAALLAVLIKALATHQVRYDLAVRMGVQAPTAEAWVPEARAAIAKATP